MKSLTKTLLLLVIGSLCARTGQGQQCGLPSYAEYYTYYHAPACPAGGPNATYVILGMSTTGTASFKCTASSNVQPPPNPGTVYWSYNESSGETGFGGRYCNYNSPYSSYDCKPIVQVTVTQATSPSDYNRFYNQAYSFNPVNGACPQSGFVQDFQQGPGLACSSGGGTGGSGEPCPGSSPIVLDTTGQGFDLTSAGDGVKFDIAGDGVMKQMGWTSADSQNAFLALPAADGLVHNGTQLFGNFSPQPPSDDPNGFLALAVYDQPQYGGNGDGVIDAKDAVFNSLRLWIDSNHDGICQPNELHTLPSLGVYSISLKYSESGLTDQYGNVFRYRATVNPSDPKASRVDRKAFDVFFVTTSPSAANKKTRGVRLLMIRLSQRPNPC